MTRIYLIRHGEAIGYEDSDPALSELGQEQARQVAERLVELVGAPIDLITSPLRRARETAQPLAERWSTEALVVDAVRELPSPGTHGERRPWLRAALRSTFEAVGEQQREWRAAILRALSQRERDTAVFTHAVVISAVVGHLTDDDRVLGFLPANTSITVVDVIDGRLSLVERGAGRDEVGDVG
ncbi:MAG: histidine phosphatase family protein [Acidimicrobiales bacterium]